MNKLIITTVLVSLVGTAGLLCHRDGRFDLESTPRPRVEAVADHSAKSVHASWTIEPEKLTDVSAAVAGRIMSFGADESDASRVIHVGSIVRKGTLLARIDSAPYQAEERTAQVERNKRLAELTQKRAQLAKAQGDWERAQALSPRKTISTAEFDQAKEAYDVALANLDIANAQVESADLALARAKANLISTTILSPIDGIVVEQRVLVGQTISMKSPSLFVIARNLDLLEIRANVKEFQAESIRLGQQIHMNVAGTELHGVVTAVGTLPIRADTAPKLRTVLIRVDHRDGWLAPNPAHHMFTVSGQKDGVLICNTSSD